MTVQRKGLKNGISGEEIYANRKLEKEILKKNEATAERKKQLTVKAPRKDEAHKSNRGNRGGNLGRSR